MKNLKDIIQEKLIINKNIKSNVIRPRSLEELGEAIDKKLATIDIRNSGILDVSNIDISELTSLTELFTYCEGPIGLIKEIKGLEMWDTSNVTDMQNVFFGLSIVKKIDISNWDVSNVTSMRNMFAYCKYLKEIGDISKWNTEKLENTEFMFNSCRLLENIGNIGDWNIKSLRKAKYMFNNCEKLKLDLKKWKLTYVNNPIDSLAINVLAPNVKIR